MIDRDELLCSIKCTQVGCLAFYVDEATKECKLGTINDQSERSDPGIKAYMQIDNDGNPIAGKSPTCSGKISTIIPFEPIGPTLQGCPKRWTPGSVIMRRKNYVLLLAAGRRTQLFHLIFTKPGVHLLGHPCRWIGV